MDARELERALSTQREWTVDAWRVAVEGDPATRALARRLLWGAYDDAQRLRAAFRVEEDGRWCDERDRTVEAAPTDRIRLVHPLELDAGARARWGDVFAELELIAPFPQLSRATAPRDDPGADALRDFPRRPASVARLRRVLGSGGWVPGEPDDRVHVRFFWKAFPRAGLVAVARLEPGFDATGRHGGAQTVREVYFTARRPGGLSVDAAPRARLSEVPAVPLGEALHDLCRLAG